MENVKIPQVIESINILKILGNPLCENSFIVIMMRTKCFLDSANSIPYQYHEKHFKQVGPPFLCYFVQRGDYTQHLLWNEVTTSLGAN